MYQFSRTIYRELAPLVVEDCRDPSRRRNTEAVRDACDGTIRRLASDRRHFAKPARSLFREIRPHFKLRDQHRVWRSVQANINLAVVFMSRFPTLFYVDGPAPECHAFTREGARCRRAPLPGRGYCPSHKHLEEPVEHLAA